MKNYLFVLGLALTITFLGCGKVKNEEVQVEILDGNRYITNPIVPLNGTILLDLEIQLEINPYENEEFGLRYFYSKKVDTGDVILFSPNDGKAERFSKEGNYLGSLFPEGEGPGEFPKGSFIFVYGINHQIWVSGSSKLAKFSHEGKFLEQLPFEGFGMDIIDETSFVTEVNPMSDQYRTSRIMLRNISPAKEIHDGPIYQSSKDMGMLRRPDGRGGYADSWGTSGYIFTADRENKKIYLALKSEYKIEVKDLDGTLLYVIEKPDARVKISQAEKKKLLEHLLKSGRMDWILDVYPDELMAISEMKMLPNGYLAVYRISGIEECTIDVFDNEGRFVYILEFPENLTLVNEDFYDFGFSNIETRADFQAYVEYRVKNLSKIFSNY